MRPLHIAYTRSFGAKLGVTPYAAALLVVALALVGMTAKQALALHREAAMLKAALAQPAAASANAKESPRAGSQTEVTPEQARAVNRAIMRLNLPWRDLFDGLEAATKDKVSLLAIEPDEQRRVVRVTAEAANPQSMVTYIRHLKQAQQFEAALLRQHQVDERDPYHAVRFVVEMSWRDTDAAGETARR